MPRRDWQRDIENEELQKLDASGVDDSCPIDGAQGALLGSLGPRFHFRCIACGYVFSKLDPSFHPGSAT